MKLRLVVVGRPTREIAAVEAGYRQRLERMADFSIIEIPEGRGRRAPERRRQEAQALRARLNAGYVLFDERGRLLASTDWAEFLDRQPGNARLDFVIGGPDGVDDAIRRDAGRIWSLSRLTLPHMLARLVVVEQLYRALTIRAGHPYHRDG